MTDATATTFVGPITLTRKGTGFFKIEGQDEDLIIPPEKTGNALPLDVVEVVLDGESEDPKTRIKRKAGRVVNIVKRSHEQFVGKLVTPPTEYGLPLDAAILVPDWKKMHVPFVVRGESLPLEHKVVIRFTQWREGNAFPEGTLEEVIGKAGVHETEMRALALSQGFRADFPPGVVQEAHVLEERGTSLIAEEALKGTRRDMRDRLTFTIDPADAKDFDDALSISALPDGTYEIGVHIADVSFFVRPGTSIDDEAVARATSVYLVDRTIPMLPHVLSTNLCSLNPNEDRLAMSAVFIMDKQAGILSSWFGETIIHSDKRFTYEEAQEVLDTKNGPHLSDLETLNALSKIMRARRVADGAIAFDTPEVKVELDSEMRPVAIHLKERKDTHLLIEDFMLLANVAVAKELSEKVKGDKIVKQAIYRTHDLPNAEKIENLSQFLKVLGYTLEHSAGRVKGSDINALLKQAEGKPEEYLIKVATLRSMAKATYSTKNVGHFGLAFPFYTHFTSPIRRYPDLLVHRLMKHFTNNQPVSQAQVDELDELAFHSSEREVSAAEAERDSIKLKIVEFMADKVNQEFDAVISGVTDRGLYVEVTENRAEGMIRMKDLGEDYFTYDDKRYRLYGERTKKEYRLGDPIKVKLIAARVLDRELDFGLALPTLP